MLPAEERVAVSADSRGGAAVVNAQVPEPCELCALLESLGLGHVRRYPDGSVLYWQGDPVDCIFVVLEGAVRVSSLAEDGRVHTYGIFGRGRLLGADAYLLGGEHRHTAEVVEESVLRAIPPNEFESALSRHPRLAVAVMRELARAVHWLSEQVQELSFLDVQQRLKRALVRLAEEHGLKTDAGIRIDLKVTHEEIGALVSANRTTITACLSLLRRQGYLWTEGRHLLILPPRHIEILDRLSQAVVDGDEQESIQWAEEAVQAGVEPLKAIEALMAGMKQVDRAYARDELGLPDVALSAFAVKAALPLLEEQLRRAHTTPPSVGTVVIGTVYGDVHDIGKTIVAMLLRSRGFRVVDLGVSVPADDFARAVVERQPDILAMSALTTASSLEIGTVLQTLQEKGLRNRVKVLVGGGAVTDALASRVGADGYHPTARGAVELAWRFCTRAA